MFAAGLRSAAQLFCGALSSPFPARLCQSLGDGSLGSAWFIFAAITKAWNSPFETRHGYRILAPGPGCWLCKLAGWYTGYWRSYRGYRRPCDCYLAAIAGRCASLTNTV